jgi:hypothetical protein
VLEESPFEPEYGAYGDYGGHGSHNHGRGNEHV